MEQLPTWLDAAVNAAGVATVHIEADDWIRLADANLFAEPNRPGQEARPH